MVLPPANARTLWAKAELKKLFYDWARVVFNQYLPDDNQLQPEEIIIRGGFFEEGDKNVPNVEVMFELGRGPGNCLADAEAELRLHFGSRLQDWLLARQLVTWELGIVMRWVDEAGLGGIVEVTEATNSWGGQDLTGQPIRQPV